MQLKLSGQHLEITESLRNHITHRMERLQRLHDKCLSLSVVLSIDKLQHRAEATLAVAGAALHAQAGEPDMYASIDVLFDKLMAQLRRHREKICDKHPKEVRKSA